MAYNRDFQGALHGRRLKRIHEVASTTLPVVHMLYTLSGELEDTMNELKGYGQQLYQYAMECSCIFCTCPGCGIPIPGPCTPGVCPTCISPPDPCPHRAAMNELRGKIIPSFYQNKNDPIPCKMAEIKYLAEHFRRFLDNNSQLVRNEDYKDQSYWYSDEARKLRAQIKQCINASYNWEGWIKTPIRGKELEKQFEEIEKVIWNSANSMAAVENKGTWTARTDPPERDIETNIKHLEAIYNSLSLTKQQINPYSQLLSSLIFLPYHSYLRYQTEAQMPERRTRAGSVGQTITVPFVVSDLYEPDGKPEEVKSVKDPANFYYPTEAEIFPVESSPETRRFNQGKFSFRNIALAASDNNEEEEEPLITKTTCSRVVEIPIGRALDEALKLTEDILRELKNIWEKGHLIIDSLIKQNELADETTKLSDTLINLTSEENCLTQCQEVPCKPGCLPIEIPTPLGPIEGHICSLCQGPHPCRTITQINTTWSKIQSNVGEIEGLYNRIQKAKESIYNSFYKLNSEYPKKDPQHPNGHPKAGKRVPIGIEHCCKNNEGNCRDEDGDLILDKIEKRDYTLKEKLIQVQKLLNRARELVAPEEGEKSAYQLLLEQLIELQLAEKKELTGIMAAEKLDLSNCMVLFAEAKALTEMKEGEKILLNCKDARGEIEEFMASAIRSHDPEICSPDPLLDCDYFNPATKRKKKPISCYCYDPDLEWKEYPSEFRTPKNNLANDLYCCVISHEEGK
jgi:hypothetical protein